MNRVEQRNYAKEILIAARKLIDKPEKWCKGWYMNNANGNRVSDSKLAASYCLVGACNVNAVNLSEVELHAAHNALIKALPTNHTLLADFNDSLDTTHDDVMKLYDRAIADC